MSRTIKFAKAGGPEVLEFVEVQVPAPGPNEVRIKVKAIGINRAEAMWRVDDYIEPVKKFPAGLGYEAAGSVDAVGKDVSGFAVGDDVNVIPFLLVERLRDVWRGHPRSGPCRRQAAKGAFVHRGRLDLDDVRDCLRCPHRGCEGHQGDFVLIPGASSSVGLAAIQIANYAGATTIALTAPRRKKQQLLDAGRSACLATEEVDLVGR